MRLIGAILAGTSAFFLVGLLTGNAPQLTRQKKAKTQTSEHQLWLTQAGLDVTPAQFWAVSALLSAAAFTLVTVLTASPAIALVPAFLAGAAPRAYFSRKRIKRVRGLQEAWPDALRELISSIEANSSLTTALADLARSGPEPLREVLARFPTTASTLGVVPALEIVREDLADPTSDRIIEVLILAHERGGGTVTEILRELARTTTQDVRTLAEIETNALEMKINARAVFALPWITLVLVTISPGAFRDFYRSSGGLIVVLIGLVMSVGGMFWVGRLGREPVETRVFGSSSLSSDGRQL